MGQNGRTLKDSLPFIPLGFFLGLSRFSESRAVWRGRKEVETILLKLRHEKLNNGDFLYHETSDKTNAC